METDSDPTFHLDVTLERRDVVEWLQSLPPSRLREEVERTLAAGNLVLSLLSASAGEESMQRFFRPVVDRMDELRAVIQGMLNAANKSQKLGELGESLVQQQLARAFPGDEFELVSKEGHQADLHCHFKLGDSRARKALAEVKLYSNDVPSKEVEKFRRDLASTRTRYGLMVSLASRITGIDGPVHLEESADHVAVYVPNAGLDGHGVLWGAALLKSIVAYEARVEQASQIRTGAIEQAWARLEDEVKHIAAVASELRGLRESLFEARRAVSASLDQVGERALSAELRLQHSVERMTTRLAEELRALPQTGVPAMLPAPSPPDTVLARLEEMRAAGDKRTSMFEGLCEAARAAGLDVVLADSGQWVFVRDGERVAATGGTKTRVDLSIETKTSAVRLVPRCEQLKDGAVVLRCEDRQCMVKRATLWMSGGAHDGEGAGMPTECSRVED